MHRLRRRDRGIRIAHRGCRDRAAEQHHFRLDAEEGRIPDDQIGAFAHLDRTDLMADAMGDCRVDRVFGDVAFDAEIVVLAALLREPPALALHLVGRLPGADRHFADAAHGLAVGRDDREGADIMQDVFRRDRLLADAAFGKGDVFGDRRRQVMADHQHIKVFGQRVLRVGPRRVGRGRDDVRLAADLDDIRRMAAARPFGVEGMDRPALDRGDRIFHEAAFVQSVRVDHHLHVVFVGDRQAAVDGRRRRAPVLVQLQRTCARQHHFDDARPAATHCPCRQARGSSGRHRSSRSSARCARRRCRSWRASRAPARSRRRASS